MQRLCFTFEIRPGTFDEYKRRHDEIWPELVAELKGAGLSNYSLFKYDDGRVVGYVECEPDAATCFAELANAPANRRWSAWFEDIIVALTDENGQMPNMEEIWHLD
ncbi:MAG TPA: L-rhamnose mutarotase [Acidimicrobiales bacterium]|nr:L-rhamnose mutarotase [Acidimicrobiales bacterium]